MHAERPIESAGPAGDRAAAGLFHPDGAGQERTTVRQRLLVLLLAMAIVIHLVTQASAERPVI
jgi:hypothetical protein